MIIKFGTFGSKKLTPKMLYVHFQKERKVRLWHSCDYTWNGSFERVNFRPRNRIFVCIEIRQNRFEFGGPCRCTQTSVSLIFFHPTTSVRLKYALYCWTHSINFVALPYHTILLCLCSVFAIIPFLRLFVATAVFTISPILWFMSGL